MPPPEGDTLAAVTSEVVGQIQDRARPLGLTWQLVKATVTAVASSAEATILFDGDTVPVGAISMVGPAPVGARVWVMVVPPGGNYIVGAVDGRFGAGPIGRSGYLTAGNVASSTANEVAIPAGSWTVEPEITITPGRICRFTITTLIDLDTATDSRTVIRIRVGSATTTGTILVAWHASVPSSATTASASTFVWYAKNTSGATVTTKLSLTNDWDAGATTISLAGFGLGNPLLFVIEDFCHVDDAPDLAAAIQSF